MTKTAEEKVARQAAYYLLMHIVSPSKRSSLANQKCIQYAVIGGQSHSYTYIRLLCMSVSSFDVHHPTKGRVNLIGSDTIARLFLYTISA